MKLREEIASHLLDAQGQFVYAIPSEPLVSASEGGVKDLPNKCFL